MRYFSRVMRYFCYTCGKSVTSELPADSVIRALLICPECIEEDKVTIHPMRPIQLRLQFDEEDEEFNRKVGGVL